MGTIRKLAFAITAILLFWASAGAGHVYNYLLDASGNVLLCCSKTNPVTGWNRCSAGSSYILTSTTYYMGVSSDYFASFGADNGTNRTRNHDDGVYSTCANRSVFTVGAQYDTHHFTMYWDNIDADPS